MAFLDAMPFSEGHTLVISRKHYENILEIPDEELANVFRIVKKVAAAIVKSERAEGIRIVQNNGTAAHQIIFHFHVHVIPQHERQDLKSHREFREQGELEKVAAKIRKFI
jgi:diadenosine tetraphosphate (Ap4A) HIT family hydrolase